MGSAPKGIFLPGPGPRRHLVRFCFTKKSSRPLSNTNRALCNLRLWELPLLLLLLRQMIAFWNHFPVCNTSYSLVNAMHPCPDRRQVDRGKFCLTTVYLDFIGDSYWTFYFQLEFSLLRMVGNSGVEIMRCIIHVEISLVL